MPQINFGDIVITISIKYGYLGQLKKPRFKFFLEICFNSMGRGSFLAKVLDFRLTKSGSEPDFTYYSLKNQIEL